MRPKTRLIWCAVIIIFAASYAVLIYYNTQIARAVMLGYIGLLLTIFTAINVWKRS